MKMNKERNWLVTRIRQKFQNDEDFHAAIDLHAWDQMTPKERHEYVEKNIQDGFFFESRYYGYSIPAKMSGKFERNYYSGGEIDLDVAALEREGMLRYEWEARGYMSHEDMCANEDWDEEDDEETQEAAQASA